MKEKLKAAWRWVCRELTVLETWAKSLLAAAFTGGLNVVLDAYHNGKVFELSAAHLLEMKAKFIYGALTGLGMYWLKSPFGKKAKDAITGGPAPGSNGP